MDGRLAGRATAMGDSDSSPAGDVFQSEVPKEGVDASSEVKGRVGKSRVGDILVRDAGRLNDDVHIVVYPARPGNAARVGGSGEGE